MPSDSAKSESKSDNNDNDNNNRDLQYFVCQVMTINDDGIQSFY